MRILLVDDDRLSLEYTESVIRSALPDGEIITVDNGLEALDKVLEAPVDLAFLDIEMPIMTGVELARELQKIQKHINIVFNTSFKEYAFDALDVMCTAYFIKPIKKEDVLKVLDNLRFPIEENNNKLKVQCFGKFEVYKDGIPLVFNRSIAKELFAFLIDKNGVAASRNEILDELWPEDDKVHTRQKSLSAATMELKRSLEAVNMGQVLIHNKNSYSVNKQYLDCDYYHYLDKDDDSSGRFREEYMSQYSWAEVTLAKLYDDINFTE